MDAKTSQQLHDYIAFVWTSLSEFPPFQSQGAAVPKKAISYCFRLFNMPGKTGKQTGMRTGK